MIIQRKEMTVESKEKVRGGEGATNFVHIVDGDKIPNGKLMSEVVLKPGCSIGEHVHDGETEYYIILSGNGTVNDNGVTKTVHPGDVVITGGGDSHSIANSGKEDLVFHAIIILN
jgi:mannose-6-phosphate isomerase-like protein (cupin superfamily)